MIVVATLLLFSGKDVFGQLTLQNPQVSSSVEKCAASFIHSEMMQTDPAYAQRMQDFESYVLAQASSITPKVNATYRIPVVVHVLHKGEAVGVGTNVSDADIIRAIRNLNERYRKTLPGLNGVDTGIEFALAVRSPTGQCTNGINRVSMTGNSVYMANGVQAASSNGITDAQLKAVTSWDRTKYYNIYLVSEFDNNNGGSGVQGYAYFASAHGQSMDGAAILANNFTNDFTMTTTHELGHALNLYHTFEGDGAGANCPPAGAGQGDLCGDTPPHKRSQSDCNSTGTNSCDGNSSNALFVHNYMDYSSDQCVNTFTPNQKTRALAACSGPRASFFAASNLALVPVVAPVVNFSASNSIVCAGQPVSFYDESSCVPNTYLTETSFPNISFAWTFTNGTVTLTSTNQNPVMNFTSPGAYDVTLTVTTLAGSNTITKSSFIILGGTLTNACTPNVGASGNYGQTVSKVQFNGINSSTSVYLNNYQNLSCSQNTILNAGGTYPISITANAGPTSAERFEVYIDYNNDGIFTNPGELVHSGTVAVGSNTINSQTLTANVILPASAVTNTFLRMRVIADAANITAAKRNCTGAFYIGDVQDYGVYIKTVCTVAPAISTQPVLKTICAAANTTFEVTASNAVSYQWQVSTNGGTTWTAITNAGVYSNATTQTLTITGALTSMNSYRYRCITTNTCGTTNSNNAVLTVNAIPTITSTTPGNRCGTGTVALQAAASAGTLSWFTVATGGTAVGTGTSFTTPSISANTTYYVESTNGTCKSVRTAVLASIGQNIALVSSPTNTTICVGGSVTLTASNSSSYSWSSGQTSSAITVSPTATTTYTVTGGFPACTNTASVTVTVTPTPAITSTTPATLCGSGSATLQASASSGTLSWFASATGGSAIGTGTSFTTPAITSTTTYYVSSSNGNCTSARTAVVATVGQDITLVSSPSYPAICSGENVILTASNSSSYNWSTGQTVSTISVAPTSTTTYTVTGGSSGCVNTASITVVVTPSPTILSTVSGIRCGAGTLPLQATASAGILSWFTTPTGGSAIGSGNSFTTPSISATTTYYVEANNGDCFSVRSPVIATVNENIAITSNPINPVICAGQSIELYAANGSSYSWSNGQAGISIVVSPTQTTTYTVTGTSSCANSASITVTVDPCLGVDENESDKTISIYPNPSNSFVTIEGENLSNFQHVELRDVTGRLIFVEKVSGSTMKFDVSNLADGNYIVHIFGTSKTTTRKIQVVR